MLPSEVICPECMTGVDVDPFVLEYSSPGCDAVFYPGEDPLGTDFPDFAVSPA